jgi:hypothetical protein
MKILYCMTLLKGVGDAHEDVISVSAFTASVSFQYLAV